MTVNEPGGRCAVGLHLDHEGLVQAAFERHRQMVFGRALAATHDPAVADDVVQDAFARLLSEVCAGRRPDNVPGWLYQVAMNLVMSRARHAEVERRFQPALIRRQEGPSPEATVEAREHAREIERALTALPDPDRAVILLAAAGATGSELGRSLGRSELAARTALCRARARLRHELAMA